MINHVSISAHNPELVGRVLATLWNGYLMAFPPCPGGFIVIAGDDRGSAIEITPFNVELLPGYGLPEGDPSADVTIKTEEFEGQFAERTIYTEFSPTHIALNTQLNVAEVMEIARREGWRTLACNRGGGMFQLIEVWLENRILIEVFTPEMTKRYQEVLQPAAFMSMGLECLVEPSQAQTLELVA